MSPEIEEAAAILKSSKRAFVFTGAGVSTESGIPDFRSPGGVWSKYRMITYQEFLADEDARREQWRLHRDMYREFAGCKPNAAHQAITELYNKGVIEAVVTQNIDSLHQESGMPDEDVLELHGNEKRVKCLECGAMYGRDEIQQLLNSGTEIPLCEKCGGILKTTTIWFGEPMPMETLDRSFELAGVCDCCVVVGSSLTVQPASAVPEHAVGTGAKLIVINRDPTAMNSYADVVISASAGEALQSIAARF